MLSFNCAFGGTSSVNRPSFKSKSELAQLIQVIAPESAKIMRRESARVVYLSTPWIKNGEVFVMTLNTKLNPVTFIYGVLNSNLAVVLSSETKVVNEFIKKSEVHLDDINDVRAHALAIFEIIRQYDPPEFVLVSKTDLKTANDSAEGRSKDNDFDSILSQIQPPTCRKSKTGWEAKMYVLSWASLVLWTLQIEPNGTFNLLKVILIENSHQHVVRSAMSERVLLVK